MIWPQTFGRAAKVARALAEREQSPGTFGDPLLGMALHERGCSSVVERSLCM